jgi:hypothetical protein
MQVLLLDEATSALDNQSEKLVQVSSSHFHDVEQEKLIISFNFILIVGIVRKPYGRQDYYYRSPQAVNRYWCRYHCRYASKMLID